MGIEDFVKLYICIGGCLSLFGGFNYLCSAGDEALEKWGARLFFGGFLWPCMAGYFVVPALIWVVKALSSMWKAAQWKRN